MVSEKCHSRLMYTGRDRAPVVGTGQTNDINLRDLKAAVAKIAANNGERTEELDAMRGTFTRALDRANNQAALLAQGVHPRYIMCSTR
jgi:hypothetical protein